MPNSSKAKGDKYELEAARLLADLTGWNVHRIRAGAARDTGDLYGLPNTCCGVKAYPSDYIRSIREALAELPAQQANSGCNFGMSMIRRPGGRWFVIMTPEQAMTLLREATSKKSEI
jgi:hypothetical protein